MAPLSLFSTAASLACNSRFSSSSDPNSAARLFRLDSHSFGMALLYTRSCTLSNKCAPDGHPKMYLSRRGNGTVEKCYRRQVHKLCKPRDTLFRGQSFMEVFILTNHYRSNGLLGICSTRGEA